MLLLLPEELRGLILSYFTRKEYKESVPCKSLLLCKCYLSLKEFYVLKKLPIVILSLTELQKLFVEACKDDNIWFMDKLITDFGLDPSIDFEFNFEVFPLILWASVTGKVKVVERLLKDPRVDPTTKNNFAICTASHFGHLPVVERLLLDPRVDPSANDNYAIDIAFTNGHLPVIERLLKDPRFGPPKRIMLLSEL